MNKNSANMHAATLTNLCGDLMLGKLPPEVFANSVAVISKEMAGVTKEECEFEVVTMNSGIEDLEEVKAKMVDFLKDILSPHIQVLKSKEAGITLMSIPVYTGEGVCQKMIGDSEEDVIDWESHDFREIGKAS